MRNFFISGDPTYRAAVQTDDGRLVAFPHAEGGKIDGTRPALIDGFQVLSDEAGISERSHLGDPVLERLATSFTQTLKL